MCGLSKELGNQGELQKILWLLVRPVRIPCDRREQGGEQVRVVIHHNDEDGKPMFSVAKAEDVEDWLDSFPTLKGAMGYCSRRGHTIVNMFCSISDCKCITKGASK